MRRKFKLKVSYTFNGCFTLRAASGKEAARLVSEQCGTVLSAIQTTLGEESEVDWHFDKHPRLAIREVIALPETLDGEKLPRVFGQRRSRFRRGDGGVPAMGAGGGFPGVFAGGQAADDGGQKQKRENAPEIRIQINHLLWRNLAGLKETAAGGLQRRGLPAAGSPWRKNPPRERATAP